MPWLSRNNYVPTDKVHSEMFNSLANDDRQWGGNVNGGGWTLSNVVIAGLLTDPTQAKGDLIVRGLTSLTRLPVGLQGQVLVVDDQTPSGLKWIAGGTGGGGGISPNDTSTQRVRVSRAGTWVATRHEINFVPGSNVTITVGEDTDNNRVNVGIASTGGGGGMIDPTTTRGDLIVRGANPPVTRLPAGANGAVLTADSVQALGVKWALPAPPGMVDPTTDKGDLIVRGSAAPATKLPLGSNGFVLTADSNANLGVKWAAIPPAGVPTSRVIGAGYGLTGGGDLSADRAFAVVDEASIQKIRVSLFGSVRGTQPEINFVAGDGIAMTVIPDTGGKKVDVTIVNTGGGGGGGGGIPDVLEEAGDLVVQGPSEITRISVGTNTQGYVLTRDDGDPRRVIWAPVAAGGQNQSPWLGNIDGAGHILSNAQIIANHPLTVQADAGGNCNIALQQGGLNRWVFGDTADAASDLFIGRYSDAGSLLDSPITIERATGNIAFAHDLSATVITASGNIHSGGTVSASSVSVTGSILVNGVPLSQTPWTSDIDAGTYSLFNASNLFAQYFQVNTAGSAGATMYSVANQFFFYMPDASASAINFRVGTGAAQMIVWRSGAVVIPGNVGIGTANPGAPLTIAAGTPPGHVFQRWDTTIIGAGRKNWGIARDYGSDIGSWGLMISNTDNGAPDAWVIYAGANKNVTIGEAGSSDNSARLNVNSYGATQIRITGWNAGIVFAAGSPMQAWTIQHSGQADATNRLGLYNKDYVEVVTFTQSATVGIVAGATPSNARLVIGNGDTANAFARAQIAFGFGDTSNHAHYIHTRHNGGAVVGNAIEFYTGDGTAAGVYPANAIHGLTIESGKVGIGGVTAPKNALHVGGSAFFPSSGAPPDPGDGTGPGLRMGYWDAVDYGYIIANHTAVAGKNLVIQPPGGGNVGIGTSPSYKLDVAGGRCNFASDNEPWNLMLRYNPSTIGMWLGGTPDNGFQISDLGGNERVKLSWAGFLTLTGSGQYSNPPTYDTVSGNRGACLQLNDNTQQYGSGGAITFGWGAGCFCGIKGFIEDGSANTRGSLIFLVRAAPTDNHLSEMARLDYGGNLNIKGQYRVNGVALPTSGLSVLMTNTVISNANCTSMNFTNGNSLTINMSGGGAAVGIWYNYVSDIRIKQRVHDLEGGLSVIDRLRPVSFEHNGALGHAAGKKNVSIITQELREILPDCVYPVKQKLFPTDEEETELLAYDPQHILYHLVLAVKQLKKKLGELNDLRRVRNLND